MNEQQCGKYWRTKTLLLAVLNIFFSTITSTSSSGKANSASCSLTFFEVNCFSYSFHLKEMSFASIEEPTAKPLACCGCWDWGVWTCVMMCALCCSQRVRLTSIAVKSLPSLSLSLSLRNKQKTSNVQTEHIYIQIKSVVLFKLRRRIKLWSQSVEMTRWGRSKCEWCRHLRHFELIHISTRHILNSPKQRNKKVKFCNEMKWKRVCMCCYCLLRISFKKCCVELWKLTKESMENQQYFDLVFVGVYGTLHYFLNLLIEFSGRC